MPRRSVSGAAQQQQQQQSIAVPTSFAPFNAATSSNAIAASSSDPFMSNVGRLRRNWKFAAVCQFVFTFEDAFGMSGFKSDALEHDLAAGTFEVVPDLMRRLLYTLTLQRDISHDNWQEHLHTQYERRREAVFDESSPPDNPLSSPEGKRNWESLSLSNKVSSLLRRAISSFDCADI